MNYKSKALTLLLACSVASAASPSIAEEYIGVEVEVANAIGAPEIRAGVKVPFGKKSDAAMVSFSIKGLEPSKPVLFTVSPSPDAVSRFESDPQGLLNVKLELPYGLEPGPHDIDVLTFFGSEDVAASYTVARIYVNDFGILTESDGSYPAGTKPAQVLLPNSEEQFPNPPTYQTIRGTLRVSEPQVKILQGLLPSVSAVMSFNNDTNSNVDLEVKMTLFTLFGTPVGEPFYSKIDNLPPEGTQAVLLNFADLPPLGFFTLKTELILPDSFVSDQPVKTSYSSSIFAPALSVIGLLVLLLIVAAAVKRTKRKSYRQVQ